MAVRIRLRRIGKKKQPQYRLVVAEGASPRDGRFIESIGRYNPRVNPPVISVDEERALSWLRQGAQPSDTAKSMLVKTGVWEKFSGEPAPTPAHTPQAVAEEPAQAAAEEPAQAVAEEPAQAVAEEPAQAVAEEPAEAVAEEPVEAVAEEPAEAAAEEPAEAAAEEPAETPEQEPMIEGKEDLASAKAEDQDKAASDESAA